MTRTWQEIAAEAAQEKDAQKLIKLAVELDSALEERDQVLHKHTLASERAVKEKSA